MRQGDTVFAYKSGVTGQQIVGLARITQGLHLKDGVEGFSIDEYQRLDNPVPLASIQRSLREDGLREFNWHRWVDRQGRRETERLLAVIDAAGNETPSWSRGASGRIRFVTFHQSFAYEEFVEGIRPVTREGRVHYEVRDGVFKRMCQAAREDSDHRYLLIIDEINRANIAKVFGELITLIEDDKRIGEANELRVALPYSQESFGVPRNLILLGTMNTADRSIALLDIALRRRFTFLEVMPRPDLLPSLDGISLSKLLETLNGKLAGALDADHTIGHSYLMGVENLADLRFAWDHRIVPLLQEFFYGDVERLRDVLGPKFVITNGTGSLGNYYGENSGFRLARLTNEQFRSAIDHYITSKPAAEPELTPSPT